MTDYLILGGGLAGCVIASRLKQYNPSSSVTLVEGGPDEHDNPPMIEPMGIFQLHMSTFEYNYRTVPQANYDKRQSLQLGRESVVWFQLGQLCYVDTWRR